MNKKFIWIGVAVVVALYLFSTYNGLIGKDEAVGATWADVEVQYQRRADLIPNLVNTVKGYATHEKSTLDAVVKARAQATSINMSVDELTPAKMAEFQKAQAQVKTAIGRLVAISERYPDLKANQNFMELQAQLEGTENRISVARQNFNKAIKSYNVGVRRFPSNLIAMIFGFDVKAQFSASEGSNVVPTVAF